MHMRHLPAAPFLSDADRKASMSLAEDTHCARRHSRAVESSPPWETPRCPSTGKWARSVVCPNTGELLTRSASPRPLHTVSDSQTWC